MLFCGVHHKTSLKTLAELLNWKAEHGPAANRSGTSLGPRSTPAEEYRTSVLGPERCKVDPYSTQENSIRQ